MPISSTNSRLTREIYKPPPKSLEQIRLEEAGHGGSGFSSRHGTPGGISIQRERHLDHFPTKRTAVVEPIKDTSASHVLNGSYPANGFDYVKNGGAGAGALASNGKGLAYAGTEKTGCFPCLARFCCICHGLFCTRCSIIAFLIGLLLGALITGLIVGLILDAQLQAAGVAVLAAEDSANAGCFQSPCSAGEVASCAYTNNNTMINCECAVLNGSVPISQSGVSVGGYICSFYNLTSTTIPTMTAGP